jgi:hypothetical protein
MNATPEAIKHLGQKTPTVRLLPTLVVSIGILVLLSAGSVLVVNWIADRRIVQEFSSRLIARVLSAEERSLRGHLDAAIDQGDSIAAAIGDDRFQFGEPALADFVSGTLAAAPQVYGLVVSDRNGEALRVIRGPANGELKIEHFKVVTDSQFAALADQIRTRKQSYWGARFDVPISPTMTGPIWTPMRMRTGFSPAAMRRRRERALDGDSSPASRSGRVFNAGRRPPKGHNGVANELIDGSTLLFDAGGDEREVLFDEVGDLGGGHFFAYRCEAHDVGEHDGEHTFFGPRAHAAFLN